jgi:hypothetical protein
MHPIEEIEKQALIEPSIYTLHRLKIKMRQKHM